MESALQDEFHIRRLVDKYTEAANRSDTKAMASLFVMHGKLAAFGNPDIISRHQIQAVYARTLAPLNFVHQLCSGALIKLEGTKATGCWSVTEFNRKNGGKLTIFLGSYDDDYILTSAGWQFARRELSLKSRARFEAKIQA